MLSPILFTLYTNDCVGTDITPLIKYSDDSAIENISDSEIPYYFNEVERLCAWSSTNYLDLNVKKTKKLLIDFRKNHLPVPDLVMNGVKVERVNEYTYLGAVLDEKLNLTANTDFIHRKCQSRMYVLHIRASILQTVSRCFVESVITFSFMCWFGSLSVRN